MNVSRQIFHILEWKSIESPVTKLMTSFVLPQTFSRQTTSQAFRDCICSDGCLKARHVGFAPEHTYLNNGDK